ncbi:MAG: DUF2306 domain-containing protein [Mucilaginibacter sp.]
MTKTLVNYAGWAIVLSASLYFIFDNALHYFTFNQTHYSTDYWPVHAPWLLVHIICGMTALLLGPFQFIPAIRKSYPKTHRTMGKIYLIAILIGACASFDLSVRKLIIRDNALVFGVGLAMLAIVWLFTSGMAYWAARSRNFVQHREWMVRSFVVTCAFTTFRLIEKILTERFKIDGRAAADLMAWASWSVPLVFTEIFLQGSKINKGNTALANKKKQSLPVND